MNPAHNLSCASIAHSIHFISNCTPLYKGAFIHKPIIKEQSHYPFQHKIISLYNVELLTLLRFFNNCTISQLSLYWQKEEKYYETVSTVELSASQLTDLLTIAGPHLISIQFILNNSIEVDANGKDEIFISCIPEREGVLMIKDLYQFFIYSTLIGSLNNELPSDKVSALPGELYQTKLLEQ